MRILKITNGFVTNSSSTNFMIMSKEKLSEEFLSAKLMAFYRARYPRWEIEKVLIEAYKSARGILSEVEELTPDKDCYITDWSEFMFDELLEKGYHYFYEAMIGKLPAYIGFMIPHINLEDLMIDVFYLSAQFQYAKFKDYKFDLSQLTNLGIQKIEDLDFQVELSEIRKLELHNNKISRISGLDEMVNLEELGLYNNGISEITGLERLENLKLLFLSSNNISEIKGLESLRNLRNLTISNNIITDLTGIEPLKNLEWLSIDGNLIDNLENLKKLSNLNHLSIQMENITNIDPLRELKNLSTLHLYYRDLEKFGEFERIVLEFKEKGVFVYTTKDDQK